jgi:flagellar basal-body rod protein FlgB
VSVSGLSGIIGGKTISALEQMARFTEARQKVIAENIANVDTPDYRHKNVDAGSFQRALAQALDGSRGDTLGKVSSDQVQYDQAGSMVLRPDVESGDNLMFHDGTNGQIERDMTEMSRNQILNQASVDLLRHHYRMIETAIRGRTA